MSGRGYVLNRHVSSRRNPEHQGQPSLFDGVDDEIEHNNLTDDSKATNFLSRFHEFIDPVSKYSSYFETSAMGMDHIFREVKRFYIKLVLENGWSERKYVYAVESVFYSKQTITPTSLDIAGRRYDRQYPQN